MHINERFGKKKVQYIKQMNLDDIGLQKGVSVLFCRLTPSFRTVLTLSESVFRFIDTRQRIPV